MILCKIAIETKTRKDLVKALEHALAETKRVMETSEAYNCNVITESTAFSLDMDVTSERVYYKDGKRYRKIGRNEMIQKGAMHNLFEGGELLPITSPDTVGDTPASFSPDREFFNPIKPE